jgi:hypothetical protein
MNDPHLLVAQLQRAHSGELAAGHAYRGHWRSLRDPDERARVRQIEGEEWHHRQLVGEMLKALGERPRRVREGVFWLIGRTLGALCFVAGWYAPMYGAGRLERRNIVEYEDAAVLASACGRTDFVDCLLSMAEVEWDHEQYFRAKAATHPLARIVSLWPAPPPRSSIRAQPAERGGAREAVPPAVSER